MDALVVVTNTLQFIVANTPGLQWWHDRAFTATEGCDTCRTCCDTYPMPLEVTVPQQYALPEGWSARKLNEDIAGLRHIDPTLVMPFALPMLYGAGNVCYVDGAQCGTYSAHCTFCERIPNSSDFRCCCQCIRLMCRTCYADKQECCGQGMIKAYPWIFQCDLCERYMLPRWSNPGVVDVDLCLDCVTPEAKADKGLVFAHPDNVMPLFGSLLEWLPLYEDALGNRLLYNGAVGSPRLGRWCIMCVDDRGRRGFHTMAANLPDLKAELEASYAQWLHKYPDDVSREGWNAKYLDAPLQRAVNNRQHMEKCYG